jgi:hypothetical protein
VQAVSDPVPPPHHRADPRSNCQLQLLPRWAPAVPLPQGAARRGRRHIDALRGRGVRGRVEGRGERAGGSPRRLSLESERGWSTKRERQGRPGQKVRWSGVDGVSEMAAVWLANQDRVLGVRIHSWPLRELLEHLRKGEGAPTAVNVPPRAAFAAVGWRAGWVPERPCTERTASLVGGAVAQELPHLAPRYAERAWMPRRCTLRRAQLSSMRSRLRCSLPAAPCLTRWGAS